MCDSGLLLTPLRLYITNIEVLEKLADILVEVVPETVELCASLSPYLANLSEDQAWKASLEASIPDLAATVNASSEDWTPALARCRA